MYLRLPQGISAEELNPILHYCQMSSVDGVVAPGLRMVSQIAGCTKGRLPVMGSTAEILEAQEMLRAGASLVELSSRGLPVLKLLKSLENNNISKI